MRPLPALGLVATLSLVAAAAGPPDAPSTAVKPAWAYGHDLPVRGGGASDFAAAKSVGVEVYRDAAAGALVAVTHAGGLAVTAADGPPAGGIAWLFAHDYPTGKGTLGVEGFKDAGSGKLLCVSQAGMVAFAPPPAATAPAGKAPTRRHAVVLKVRNPTETDFGPQTAGFEVDCAADPATGGLVYTTAAGRLAAAPAPAGPAPEESKPPVALYGLTVKARQTGEAAFGPATKAFGVEVFRDENTGGLLYVSETGSIATAPAAAKPGPDGVVWTHALAVRARPAGASDFKTAAPVHVEAYRDSHTGHTLYVTDAGAIAVLAKK